MAFALDLVAAILVTLALVRGWFRGFLYQIGQVAVIAVAWILAEILGGVLEPAFRDVPEIPAALAPALGFLGVFGIVYGLGAFSLWRLSARVRESRGTLSSFDRLLGMAVGGAKGAVMVYLLVVTLIMAHRLTAKLPIPYASSYVGRWVMQHNFLDEEDFPRAKALVKLGWLLRREPSTALATDPHFQAIMGHAKAAFLWSPEMMTALAASDWPKVLADERVWDLLDEPEIQAHLDAMEWGEAPAATGRPAPPAEAPWVPMPFPPARPR